MIQTPNGPSWIDLTQLAWANEFRQRQEDQYWAWVVSGKRTLEMFGEEGAKRVLEEQRKRDEEDTQS